ncbi:phosphatidylinositol N-acetylglucosaminyltransferase subunit P [Magnolia sinica]|uniref:phosphatidylinositol N-acetylglucosaminyltransferase subunit P n=1 Tax=Magnolia sinica TaxID=86752 RepID=UPI002659F69D|nr:phosphatidylinositol N-acetylglucosaminyltransferase subunit P [Magnolia sinica]
MADSSLNSLRRTLSVSKERATVSLLDSDERAAVISLSEEHGLKPSEVYGFVGSISTIVTTAIFLAWAYIPECWLHYLGITYYPSRYWALAVPAFAMVTVFLAIGFYLGLNFMVTPPPTSFDTIYDECSREPSSFVAAAEGAEQPIEPITDIAISHINDLMFGQTM